MTRAAGAGVAGPRSLTTPRVGTRSVADDEYGLEISAGKMSALWTGTPTTIRLDDLDVICSVLDCDPTALLIREPDKVAARRPDQQQAASATSDTSVVVTPRFGRPRSEPPL